MGFEKGNPGKPKGTKNKKTKRVEDTAERLGVDPFEVLCLYAKGDWEALGEKERVKVSYTSAGIEFEELTISHEMRVSAAKEACKYMYSQKRSVDFTGELALLKEIAEMPDHQLESQAKLIGKKDGNDTQG